MQSSLCPLTYPSVACGSCFALCNADVACQQAKFEAGGPHGDECWLGTHAMSLRPTQARAGCVAPNCTDTCYNKNGWYSDGIDTNATSVLVGWCNNPYAEASAQGNGQGTSYWSGEDISAQVCFANCNADHLCQQARYEANGPYGNECWIGTNKNNPRPIGTRPSCVATDGCTDFCYSKSGWYPDNRPRVVNGWCSDPNWVEGATAGVGIGVSYFHNDALTQTECFGACEADSVCTMARFEAMGQHGTECWLGTGRMMPQGESKRSSCAATEGCVDYCYSKTGFH